MTYRKLFRFLATLVVFGTHIGNYAVEIIQMTFESALLYEICPFFHENCSYVLTSNRINLGLVALDSH